MRKGSWVRRPAVTAVMFGLISVSAVASRAAEFVTGGPTWLWETVFFGEIRSVVILPGLFIKFLGIGCQFPYQNDL